MDRDLVVALDHEPRMLEHLRERFPNARNLQTVLAEADDEQSISRLATLDLDSCVCLNVLEHVRDDVAALRAMARAIHPEGAIILIVPAFPSLYGPVDRKLGHYRRYTRQSFAAAAHNAGLRVREMRYLNAPGFFGWWLNAHILKRDAQSAAQIAIFDRYLVPLAARVESIFRAPFGQSLFAVISGNCSPRNSPNPIK
jgi:SAM-dependent methyltransferase